MSNEDNDDIKIMMGVYIDCWSVLINTKKYGIKLNVLINRKMMILMVWWSDDYDADYDDNNYMKIKIISDDDLPLSRLFLSDVVILIRSVFEDNGTYYPQLFLEKAFYDEEKSSLFKFDLIQP